MEDGGAQRPHVAILPTPGMGHLFPIAEFAKLLVDRHGFTVTIITFAESANKAQSNFLASLPSSITTVGLPPVPLSDLPPDARIETRISLASARAVPSVRSVLLSLRSSTRLVAFVVDPFASPAYDAAQELSIPRYVFIPSNLQLLTLMLHLNSLHAATNLDFWQLPEPVCLPGFPPIPGPDILHPLQNRKNPCYEWMLEQARRYRESDGILVNSFDAIEAEAAKLLTGGDATGWPRVYPVGPLIRTKGAAREEGAYSIRWLDEQPQGSVIYVSFGSGGTLSTEQLGELAMGLEASGQRFLWMLRSPSDANSAASYFTARSPDDPLTYLPEGFLERTKGVGLVVASWAPQIEVLGHAATGGFLSHCGWNSTMESVSKGVPMIAWPLFAEQRMNAVMLVEGVGVALRVQGRDDGLVERAEVSRVVRELMESEKGKDLRKRAKEWEAAAAKALAEEDGSSSRALAVVAERWKKYG